MSAMASEIMVYSTDRLGADQRKYQSSMPLAFVMRIHRWPVNSPHKKAINAENLSIWWSHHIVKMSDNWLGKYGYRQVSNIRHSLEDNKVVDHSDVVGASPVGAAPTTSSFST